MRTPASFIKLKTGQRASVSSTTLAKSEAVSSVETRASILTVWK